MPRFITLLFLHFFLKFILCHGTYVEVRGQLLGVSSLVFFETVSHYVSPDWPVIWYVDPSVPEVTNDSPSSGTMMTRLAMNSELST